MVLGLFFFSHVSSRGNEVQKEGRMSYADFVWLLISEEDKRSATRSDCFLCLSRSIEMSR